MSFNTNLATTKALQLIVNLQSQYDEDGIHRLLALSALGSEAKPSTRDSYRAWEEDSTNKEVHILSLWLTLRMYVRRLMKQLYEPMRE